ncbi:hypothetical protein ACFQHO_50745 [Actinomadura yumaensis]|uniref:hypothetical protein n=1 Tax=Actinomadura yumaensis TaxID=111807 RepID=UPI0036143171
MGDDGSGPRGARALTAAYVLCVAAVFALSRARYFGFSWTSAAYLAAVAPVVVLQVVLLGPRARPRLLLPALAAFTYLPFLVFGGIWIGLPAFLAGSFLITVRGRARWALFAAAAASAAASGGAYGGGAGGCSTRSPPRWKWASSCTRSPISRGWARACTPPATSWPRSR